LIQKANLRKEFLALRAEISSSRREEASKALAERMKNTTYNRILSFVSFGSEIELMPSNQIFIRERDLILPRCNPKLLELYSVKNFDRDLIKGSYGTLEPNPEVCLRIDPTTIQLVLVPGLAFDDEGYRLGYGKGYYDKLLAQLTHFPIQISGIGFKEQKSSTLLPRDSWDLPVQEVLLF